MSISVQYSQADAETVRQRIAVLRERNVAAKLIASQLGMNLEDVRAHLKEMRAQKAQERERAKAAIKLRPCLRCRREFRPEHKGNFMCSGCKSTTAGLA
ncbi:hypothetical protein K2X14_11480 [Acetobacter sp. TBRC 12305]|uniref:Uncharacterized protein n=1 Tax=Acetobacter garciniae TaxID=2817435 RepID=A0A939HQ20_9PROT|nr:hypothetical protein [Acetobacter garciniae]MBO1325369.1 hypothetical protein [Acetobacter garciniae]MBX0345459.1 hypothetical protein [Acetobacter garciniae]